jgi:nucleoside-diphosphate-sugar epimerase
VLLNNIAWCLRRFPLFLVPGRGDYPLQPVAAEDVASLAVDASERAGDEEFDAAGPDTLAFSALVRAIRSAIGSRTPLVAAPPKLAHGATTIVGRARRDTMLTADELTGLMAGLLASREPPRGRLRLQDWLEARGKTLGRRYVSERVRNWRCV